MPREVLVSAVLVAVFCVLFSAFWGTVSMTIPFHWVLVLSAASGGLGRIFAWAVFERRR